jgi:hypothetical protein
VRYNWSGKKCSKQITCTHSIQFFQLAEAIVDLEQDEQQSRARFTHLRALQYYTHWRRNSEYHDQLMEKYKNNDVGLAPKRKPAESRAPEQTE